MNFNEGVPTDPVTMENYYNEMLVEMRRACEEHQESLCTEGDAFHVQAVMAAQLVPFLERPWAFGEAAHKAKTLIMLLHAQEHLQRHFAHLFNGEPLQVNDAEGCANYSIFALLAAGETIPPPACGDEQSAPKRPGWEGRAGEAEDVERIAGKVLANRPKGPAPVERRVPVTGSGSGGRNETEGE